MPVRNTLRNASGIVQFGPLGDDFSKMQEGEQRESHFYSIYNLAVESEVVCPGLPAISPQRLDVTIRFGPVPGRLESPRHVGYKFEARGNRVLLKTNLYANFLVSGGKEITIQPHPGARMPEIRLLLFGWVFAALMHLRSSFPLHGSVVDVRGQGVAFCGPSGSGKSCLAKAVVEEGFGLLDDNVVVFSMTGNGPMVHPGYPKIRLWDADMRRLALEPEIERGLLRTREKYAIDASARFSNAPVPLSRILIITSTDSSEFELKALNGGRKMVALIENTFCLRFVQGLGVQAAHFLAMKELAKVVPVFFLKVPRHPNFARRTLDRLMKKRLL